MKVTVPMLLAISLAVAGMMMSMSGFNEDLGVGHSTGLEEDARGLDEDVDSYSADRVSDQGSYLGVTVEGAQAVVDGLKWSLALPVALINVGFPAWFAIPLASPVQFVSYIGVWQIIRGMRIS
ncbi:hypothetical protein [Haloprofundus halobius]|uniref:hypothetical protein n=1 Tax=Haloprofundus halobius TaxID=2876194 RepID=UPI001CC9E8D7|nr:hypothetical protein [Haloprofundus halobius]